MDFIDDKVWKPIHTLPGYECCIEYYVNDKGQVKSTKGLIERILKQRINKNGYAQVNLLNVLDVSKLLLLLFIS